VPGPVRDCNEDSFAIVADATVLIVSDGISQKPGGAQASMLVTRWLPQLIEEQRAVSAPQDSNAACVLLRDALVYLNERIRAFGAATPDLHGLGATVVAAWLIDDTAIVAHLGDSRAYLLRDERLALLTSDHTIAGLLLRSGVIAVEEAQRHPGRSVLSRYVGMEKYAYADVRAVPLRPGDRLLLCTDGLTGVVSNDVIGEVMRRSALENAAQALVDRAVASSSPDNVTVVVAEWCAGAGRPEDPHAR
jgi:serine/threonine protein phosphatase PrpC